MPRRGPSACSGKWRAKGGLGSRYGEGEAREGGAGDGTAGTRKLGPFICGGSTALGGLVDSEMKLGAGGWVGLGFKLDLKWARGDWGCSSQQARPPKELSLTGPGKWFSSSCSSFILPLEAGRGRGEGLGGLSLPHSP